MLNDFQQGLFIAALFGFWIVFVSEHRPVSRMREGGREGRGGEGRGEERRRGGMEERGIEGRTERGREKGGNWDGGKRERGD